MGRHKYTSCTKSGQGPGQDRLPTSWCRMGKWFCRATSHGKGLCKRPGTVSWAGLGSCFLTFQVSSQTLQASKKQKPRLCAQQAHLLKESSPSVSCTPALQEAMTLVRAREILPALPVRNRPRLGSANMEKMASRGRHLQWAGFNPRQGPGDLTTGRRSPGRRPDSGQ